MRTIVIAGFFSALIAGVVGLSDTAWAINYNGFMQNSSGALLSGITVYQTENAAVHSNPSLGDGSFTVPGLPSGTDFSLKFVDTNISPTYAVGYSRNFNRTTDASGSVFTLFTPAEISDWYTNTSPQLSKIPTGGPSGGGYSMPIRTPTSGERRSLIPVRWGIPTRFIISMGPHLRTWRVKPPSRTDVIIFLMWPTGTRSR